MQPTGHLHVGNYVGALTQWVQRQAETDSIFCVVDLHAITVPDDVRPAELRAQVREVAALILASGIDAARSPLFVQSHVSEHPELAWILNCVTPVGWLFRMTQYKSQVDAGAHVSAGLLKLPRAHGGRHPSLRHRRRTGRG